MKIGTKSFAIILYFLLLVTYHLSGSTYQLTNLGLHKYSFSKVTSINNNDYICGHLLDGIVPNIFVLDEKKQLAIRNETLRSLRFIINNSNAVFGSIITHAEDYYWIFNTETVFRWQNPMLHFQYFHFYYLGAPYNQHSTSEVFKRNIVWDANDLGQILIMNNISIKDAAAYINHIWVYDKKSFYKISHIKLDAAIKINNHSQILGIFYTATDGSKIKLPNTSIYDFNNKTIQVLDLPGPSIGADINDHGQVVGVCYNIHQKKVMGFLTESSGNITFIDNFSPIAINNHEMVIGTYLEGAFKDRPALYIDGYVYSLTEVVDPTDDTGLTWDSLDAIVDINDKGWIIGNGVIDGKEHGFLLKPILK